MTGIKPLVLMQLKDKMNLSFLKSKKQTLFKAIFALLTFALITVAVFFVFRLAQRIKIFSIVEMIPISVIVVIVSVMQLLSIVSCSYGLMSSFYFSPDNPVLLTMPVSSTSVFASKLIVYYVNELIKNLTYMLPVLFAYGLVSGYGFLYYPWIILCIIPLSALPVVIGAFLSIPAMLVTLFLRQYKFLQIIILACFVGLIVLLVFKGISLIPDNLNLIAEWGAISNNIQDFLTSFSKIMLPFAYLTQMLVGVRKGYAIQLFSINTLWILLCVIAIIGFFLSISFLLSKPLFLKMASKPFEYKKVTIFKHNKNVPKQRFWSSLHTEFKNNFRTSAILTNTVVVFFALPMAIFFFDKLLSSMNTRLLGQHMSYAFNVLIILLILLSNNSSLSAVYSREGLMGPIAKTRPIDSKYTLFPKLIWQMLFSSISTIITIVIFQSILPIGVGNMLLFMLAILLFNVGHIFWCAEIDFMNPMFQQYQTFGASANNPNERKVIIISFIMSFVVFGLAFFLFEDNYSVSWLKIFLIALIFFVYRIITFVTKANVYYSEKV